jgi:D-alanyl-D-alanine carboxypeptidase/D-alanyl-D-alanine-endopeptidase (penicillin-binding protein 4)
MNQTSAGGKVFAKTGTLSGVSTLSGYALAADGEMLAFSFIMQDFTGAVKPYKNIQDSLSVILSSFRR